jgi:hypothetical protein
VRRVEGDEDIAEVIVRRSAVDEWPKPPKQFAFLAAEPCDLNEGIGSSQYREQGQQEYLVEWIHDLAALTGIRQVIEMMEKYHRFRKSAALCRRIVHGCFPPTESRGSA